MRTIASISLTTTPLTAELRANFRHLYADIAWYGLLAGSSVAFLAVFAARLGASGFEVSLLSAGPAVFNLLLSLPAGSWLEKRALVPATFWSAVLNRAGYLALIPLPWLLVGRMQIWAVIAITLLMAIPGTFLAISFNAMFADVVPMEYRGEVVAKRNAVMAISLSAATLISGQILVADWLAFPANYQLVFGLGLLGALMSTYHISRIRFPQQERSTRNGRLIGDLARPGLLRFADSFRMPPFLRGFTRQGTANLLHLDMLRDGFGPFLGAYLVFYTFQFVPIPLFPLFLVNVLHLSDSVISLGNGLFYITVFLASLLITRSSARYGHRAVMIAGVLTYGLYPLLVGLSRSAVLFWVASALSGAIWAATNSGMINRLMEKVPEDQRPAYMALHNLALNLGVLAGSLAGPVLGGWLGLRDAILLSAGFRLAAGLLLVKWG